MRDLKIHARTETKGFQWPTLAFSYLVISMTLAGIWAGVTGLVPLWAAMIWNSFWMAQGYTAAHECAHRNLNGKHRRLNWLNDFFGIAGFSFTLHSYTVHCHVHRLHHAHTNDPERDTDAWVSDAPNLPSAIFRSLMFYFHTNYFIFKIFPLVRDKRKFIMRAALETAFPFAIIITFAAMGYWREVLMLSVIPTILAFALVSFFIDWIPHHVEDKSDVMKQTLIQKPSKSLRGKFFSWIYGFHNYHLIHHLVPSIPWYAQERTFEKAETFLRANGARIREADEAFTPTTQQVAS
ncbi:fatty acid desaturase [Hyphococcus flavus]|uniref:Fatty acid desaturase n=1 Tax=Hyphococcus flavus TaxID=1866326 RepID=A0AAE9ZB94_9PROT|nr:fatty acid desaturase [Hyphococcus flavus]WDI31388.1 fatty acid desaturase [Hyphococcus flavus]